MKNQNGTNSLSTPQANCWCSCSFKKLKNVVPQRQPVNIYYALIESHLRNADDIWSSLSNTKLAALRRFQERAYSIIANASLKIAGRYPGLT